MGHRNQIVSLAFTALLDRFPAMRLAVPPAALRWDHGDGLVLRGLTELPVTLDARCPGRPVPNVGGIVSSAASTVTGRQ